MSIAETVESCLTRHRVPYAVISHPYSRSSRATAAASVPPAQIAKAVVLHDARGYLLVVVPSDCDVAIRRLSRRTGRRLRMVDEIELVRLFHDCEPGAIPPLGPAYGIDTVVDDGVLEPERVCFVSGDHDELICVRREAFRLLTRGAWHARIARPRRDRCRQTGERAAAHRRPAPRSPDTGHPG